MDLDVLGMLAKAGNMANDGSNKGDNNVNGIAALSWTFVSECPIPPDAADLMVQGEQPFLAYKTFRDSALSSLINASLSGTLRALPVKR